MKLLLLISWCLRKSLKSEWGSEFSLNSLLLPVSVHCHSLFSSHSDKHERESTSSTSWLGSASMTKGGSVCHPELCLRSWLPASQWGQGKGVRWGGWVFTWGCTRLEEQRWSAAGTGPAQWGWCGSYWVYLLRKKERQGQGSESTINKEAGRRGKVDNIWIYVCVSKWLAAFMYLSQMLIAWIDETKRVLGSVKHFLFFSGYRPDLIIGLSSILSTEIRISSFCPVVMSNRKWEALRMETQPRVTATQPAISCVYKDTQ